MKTKTIFVCQSCGAQSARWVGKCPSCESWNSYVEENTTAVVLSERMGGVVLKESPVLLSDVFSDDKKRYTTDQANKCWQKSSTKGELPAVFINKNWTKNKTV